MEYYIFFWDEKNCSENDNCDLSTLCQNICYLVFCNLGTMYILKGSLNRWIYSVIIFSCCIVYPEISCISLGEKNEMNILKMFSQYSRVPNKSFYAAWQILFKTVLYCIKQYKTVLYCILFYPQAFLFYTISINVLKIHLKYLLKRDSIEIHWKIPAFPGYCALLERINSVYPTTPESAPLFIGTWSPDSSSSPASGSQHCLNATCINPVVK
jgi:hypothetical protein